MNQRPHPSASLLLLALAACGPAPEGSGPAAGGETTTTTAPPADLPTEPIGVPTATSGGCSVLVQGVLSGYSHVRRGAARGTLLAAPGFGLHVREAGGTWSVVAGTATQPSPDLWLQADDGTLYTVTSDGIHALDPATAAVTELGTPDPDAVVFALSTDGQTLWALAVEQLPGATAFDLVLRLTVHGHDGTSWREAGRWDRPEVRSAALLPDGRALWVEGDDLWEGVGAKRITVPLPQGVEPEGITADRDGHVVVLGEVPAAGPVEALALVPGLPPGYTLAALVTDGPDTTWAVATPPTGETVVLHTQGQQTTEQALAPGLEDLQPTSLVADGLGHAWLGLASATRQVLLDISADRIEVDDDRSHPGGVDWLAVDDVDGTIHAFGPYGTATWDGARWVPDERGLPLTTAFPEAVVSAGRTVYNDHRALTVADATGTHSADLAGPIFYGLAGHDGHLFAVGVDRVYEGAATGPAAFVERGDGAGWQRLDSEQLPDDATFVEAWADGPDDLWVGVAYGDGHGGLAHFDGERVAPVLDDLPRAPRWLARLADGALWLSDAGGIDDVHTLYRYDGVELEIVPTPPNTDSAWIDAQGGLVLSTSYALPDDDPASAYGFASEILRQPDADAPWEQVLATTNLFAPPLVGHDGLLMGTLDLGAGVFAQTCP